MTRRRIQASSAQQRLFDTLITELPAHGGGCQPLAGAHKVRDLGQPRYLCVPGCPRQRALARLEAQSLQQRATQHE